MRSASSLVSAQASSQDSDTYRRQSSGQDAESVAAWTLTAIWQLPTFPSVPEYCRATHGEDGPSFLNPVSSMTHASGAIVSIARFANRRLTGSTAHGED